MIVLDTSLFTDYLILFEKDRHCKAKKLFNLISERDFIIYEPFLFEVELAGILCRKLSKKKTVEILRDIKNKIETVDEKDLHKIAINIAIKTHCRAVDSYFIATAKLTNSILITNDKIMAKNAKRARVEAYYLIDEFDKVIKRVKKL